jgi:hypothetical protein
MHPATARTLQLTHSRPHNRDQPHLHQLQLQEANHNISQRLINIVDSNHPPLQAHSSYARYNHFERPFRAKNPNRDRNKREIELENEKLFNRLVGMKPRIGSLSEWKDHHDRTSSYSKIKSRYQPVSKEHADRGSLYHSTLPEALQELEASLRRIRNSGKGRGGLGISREGVRVELPKVEKKKGRGLYYDIDLYL